MSSPNNYLTLHARLMRFLWAYEALIITACIAGGAILAFGQGGTITAAVPLLLVAAAEMLRIPVSGFATRINSAGRLVAVVVLLAIAVVSFEALSLIFEQFLDNRTMTVLKAQRVVDLAEERLAAKTQVAVKSHNQIALAQSKVSALDADIANKEAHPPVQPGFSGRTCGKNNSTCTADRLARADYTRAQAAHLSTLKALREDRKQAQSDLDAQSKQAGALSLEPETRQVSAAKRELEDVKLVSPMHRLAASVLGVKVGDMTENQFEAIKRYGVLGLAGAFATISTAVSVVAHQPERVPHETKLSRALRAYLARRRKPVVRVVEKKVWEAGERTRFVYVPMPATQAELEARTKSRNGMPVFSPPEGRSIPASIWE